MKVIDLVIDARWVVPVEPAERVLEHSSVAVDAGRILEVLPSAEVDARYAPRDRVSGPEHVLIPGLVNSHTHAAMTLMRGLADDLPLMRWLREHIWPAETKLVSPEFVYDGTLLAAAEMLRGGVTCVNEMYFYPDAAARAFTEAGMRAAIGIIAIEFPTRYATDPDDYLAKGLAVRDRYQDEPRISFCMAPHAPYTVADPTFTRMIAFAEELDLPIHIHLHETRDEIEQSIAQHGVRPIERLDRLGLLSPRLIAVHAVHLTAHEIERLGRAGASVAHCPSSNLKLASGFAPVAALAAAGVNVALGTDGAASNNRLDVFQEMRTAALLAKAVANDAQVLPAHAALAAATLGGARALGLERSIGSIEPGKQADLCLVSLADLALRPHYDVISQLVYACGREQVSDVWVDGTRRVASGVLLGNFFGALENRIFLWQNKVLG